MNDTPETRQQAAQPSSETTGPAATRRLPPAAERALREAEQRRAAYLANEAGLPKELGGRKGLEPGRYGDWEVKGLTSDF